MSDQKKRKDSNSKAGKKPAKKDNEDILNSLYTLDLTGGESGVHVHTGRNNQQNPPAKKSKKPLKGDQIKEEVKDVHPTTSTATGFYASVMHVEPKPEETTSPNQLIKKKSKPGSVGNSGKKPSLPKSKPGQVKTVSIAAEDSPKTKRKLSNQPEEPDEFDFEHFGDDEAENDEDDNEGMLLDQEEKPADEEDIDFARHAEASEYRNLDKYHDYPRESTKQKLARLRNVVSGKLTAAWGPQEVMAHEKKAIIKAAVARARRYERVSRKITRNWDSSSESEECIDCYAPKNIRRTQFRMHASYRHGIKRTSLFSTLIKWFIVFIGFYDYFLTFYIVSRIYSFQMWLIYFRANQMTNCVEAIIDPYQVEVFYYCVNVINSVNLFFSMRRSNWKYLKYYLKTQVWIAVFAPLTAFATTRFNVKDGNVRSIITRQLAFHFLLTIKFAFVMYRYYMVRNPFIWRRLKWFTDSELDRQLNQDLDSRLSSFVQKKHSYRNAFKSALFSVISELVNTYHSHGRSLPPDQLHILIQKYDETLNDITLYPGIEQYLRMAYVRFCLKRAPKDQRNLAQQSLFYNLRDERLRKRALEKVQELNRNKQAKSLASSETNTSTRSAGGEAKFTELVSSLKSTNQ